MPTSYGTSHALNVGHGTISPDTQTAAPSVSDASTQSVLEKARLLQQEIQMHHMLMEQQAKLTAEYQAMLGKYSRNTSSSTSESTTSPSKQQSEREYFTQPTTISSSSPTTTSTETSLVSKPVTSGLILRVKPSITTPEQLAKSFRSSKRKKVNAFDAW